MKKLFITFILGLGLLPCFTHADTVSSLITTTNSSFSATTSYKTMVDFTSLPVQKIVCIGLTWNGGGDNLQLGFTEGANDSVNGPYTFWRDWNGKYNCLTKGSNGLYLRGKLYSSSATVSVKYFFLDDLLNANLPEMTSLECQTQYSLIPVSSVDENYCTSNDLCPSVNCPSNGVSNLFINDIFHPGAFNIVINIPEEIDWDYAYTNSGQNFNLDVVGYNQDTDYINAWIDTNNYKPTTDDFTNTFLLFKDYSGLLVALLLVILVFYFVKKLF